MRSLFRTFSLVLICLLLIASSDTAVNLYGYGSGPSTAAAQGASVVSANPRNYQTPDPGQGGEAVNEPSNMGHGNTLTSSSATDSAGGGTVTNTKVRSARWPTFRSVSGVAVSIRLRFDWSVSCSVRANSRPGGNASSLCHFRIDYSLDGGSSWINRVSKTQSVAGTDFQTLNDSGSEDILLSGSQNITQVQVRDLMRARATADAGTSTGASSEASITTSISNIRLEVETLNCPASVTADRWRGEFYNNTNLSGIPTTVRDDGAGVLSFNFGDGSPPAGTCGLTDDNFSARWTRMINFPRGVYRFTVTADDGVRLYVDGQTKIDAWVIQGPTTYTADVFLTEGNHEVKLEYVEYTSGASISLNWTTLVNCIANVAADRWKGEYYNGTTLSGELAMVHDEGTDFLKFDWGNGSPGSVCGQVVDNFSARWTRTVNFAAGTYRFIAAADSGVKLYIDGQVKIDQWGNLPPNTYTADVTLSAAPHEIKLEFAEYTGGANVSLFWGDVNCLANVPAGRWRGEYFNNITLSGFPAMVRDDGPRFLNFDFGGGSPSSLCNVAVDNFSARWTRTVNFVASAYRFSVTGDDGVRLYVDGQLKIDKWFSQGATTYTADVALTAGAHEVKLEYFESAGPAVAFLSWVDVTGVNCLPDAPLPLISSIPQTGGGESIASTAPSQAPKRCGHKNSD